MSAAAAIQHEQLVSPAYDFVPSPQSLRGRLLVPEAERELCDPNVPPMARVIKAVKYSPVFPKGYKHAVSAFADIFDFKHLRLEGRTYQRIAADLGGPVTPFHLCTPKRLVHTMLRFEVITVAYNFWSEARAQRSHDEDARPSWFNRANDFALTLTERALIKLELLAAPAGGLPERCPVCEHRRRPDIEARLRGDEDEARLARIYHVPVRALIEHGNGHREPPLPPPPRLSAPYALERRAAEPLSNAVFIPEMPPVPEFRGASPARAAAPPRAPSAPTPPARPLKPVEQELLLELASHPSLHELATPERAIKLRLEYKGHGKSFPECIAAIRDLARKGPKPGQSLDSALGSFVERRNAVKNADVLRWTLAHSDVFGDMSDNAERVLTDLTERCPSLKLWTVLAGVRIAEKSFPALPAASKKKGKGRHLFDTILRGTMDAIEDGDDLDDEADSAPQETEDVRAAARESLSRAQSRAGP